jgi:hypothetical protein
LIAGQPLQIGTGPAATAPGSTLARSPTRYASHPTEIPTIGWRQPRRHPLGLGRGLDDFASVVIGLNLDAPA